MASTIRQGFTLPKPGLSSFNGNPVEFWGFIRSFENSIEKNTWDECERLTFLLQYCAWAAKNAIRSCVTTDLALGYQTATKLLKDHFGHPFKIATAHVIQVTRGPAVKPNDQRGLKTFEDQLQDCKNVLEPIGYLDEVNSADNLSIVCPSISKPYGLTLPTASKSPVSVLEFKIFQSSSLKRPALLRIPSLEVRLIVTKTKVRKTDQVRGLVF